MISRESRTREWLAKAVDLTFEQISFCRETQRQRGIPVPETAKSLETLCRLIAESAKVDLLDLHRRKIIGNVDLLDRFDAIPTLEELVEQPVTNGVAPAAIPAPATSQPGAKEGQEPPKTPRKAVDPELLAVQEDFRNMPGADRMLARREFGLRRRLGNLEQKHKEAAAEKPTPPLGEPKP